MKTSISTLNTYITEKGLFASALALLILAAFLYAYFVNQTVVQIVERTHLEEAKADMEAELAELEMRYMTEMQELSLEDALAQGFVEGPKTRFVKIDAPVLTLREDI